MMYDYQFHSGMLAGGVLGVITWVVIVADLVLVGFWLWKQIKKD